jgi:hypothetical protein
MFSLENAMGRVAAMQSIRSESRKESYQWDKSITW